MPSCPECGLDVPDGGLCNECKKAAGKKKSKSLKKQNDNFPKKNINLVLNIFFAILIFGGGFFIGWVIFAKPFLINKSTIASESNIKEIKSLADSSKVEKPDSDSQSIKGIKDSKALAHQNTSVFNLANRKEHVPIKDKKEYIQWMISNSDEELDYISKKWDCVQLIQNWSRSTSITHDSVLEAFLRTPREYFCREKNKSKAYSFSYLDIGWGQTISGPEIVARMTNALNPEPEHKVLEIGTGSGYQSAILSELCNHVYTIEIIEPLAKVTDDIYKNLDATFPEYGNVQRKIADGYFGWEENAPFDRIIVTCGIDHIPPPLLKQLAPEGVMVIPVGPPSSQTILKITKHIDDKGNVALERDDIYKGTSVTNDQTRFVPFKASDGSSHSAERDLNK
jgi:protein-L-isoaspartate(D-aspartate) O-methyltransferase